LGWLAIALYGGCEDLAVKALRVPIAIGDML
jgi:hypothetical protein